MQKTASAINTLVARVMAFYVGGKEQIYFGENITQTQHAFQTALLARLSNADNETIIAAFLHDIGHLCYPDEVVHKMDNYGVMDHEDLGAAFLRINGFSSKVCDLISAHVDAKRYLAFKEDGYYDCLSEASKKTLEFQGGMMNEEQAKIFAANPLFNEFIALRKWDEQAKNETFVPEDCDYIKSLLTNHLFMQNSTISKVNNTRIINAV